MWAALPHCEDNISKRARQVGRLCRGEAENQLEECRVSNIFLISDD